jgi:hypothetical protein
MHDIATNLVLKYCPNRKVFKISPKNFVGATVAGFEPVSYPSLL